MLLRSRVGDAAGRVKAIEGGDAKGFGDVAMARGVRRIGGVEKSGLEGRRG